MERPKRWCICGDATCVDSYYPPVQANEVDAYITELESDLAVSRKIRRYVAFCLTGDEQADVQLAADESKASIAARDETIARLRVAGTTLYKKYLDYSGNGLDPELMKLGAALAEKEE